MHVLSADAPISASEQQRSLDVVATQQHNDQARPGSPDNSATVTVSLSGGAIYPAEYNGDVRALPPVPVLNYYHILNGYEPPLNRKSPAALGSRQSTPRLTIQMAPMPAATVNFAGISFNQSISGAQAGAGWPPDANGDVGATYYIQAVNDAWGIFEKATGALVAGFTENQLWASAATGSPCDANNLGEPVVLYDALAGRWVLTNVAFRISGGGNPVAPFYQCIAVSKTNDPVSGGYYLYAVQMDPGGAGAPPGGTLNDYPQFGLWTDCLYMAANGYNASSSAFTGAMFASFDRATLYSGAALTSTNSSIGFISGSTAPFSMIPANQLGAKTGSLPPAGTPEYFASESNTIFAFEVRKFQHGTTACGAGSALGAAVSVSQASYAFNGSPYIPQSGTSNKLDPVEDRLMQKVQYRKVGATESLWVVHTTGNGTATPAQPQWAQIDVSGGTVATTPPQQEIYAPDILLHRWTGSLAIDQDGNMALGYSTSSSTTFPSIAYVGRLATDAANQLSQTETILVAGGGSQNNTCGITCNRWGDYSSMSIDPVDDCTFWYTNEYYDSQTNGNSGNWQTRIGSFKFPSCGVANSIAFTTQPVAGGNIPAGSMVAFVVHVTDVGDNPVAAETVNLSVSSGSGVFSGTGTAITDSNGDAMFDVSFSSAGTYKLSAADVTTPSATSATSNIFTIVAAGAKAVAFVTQPAANANIAAGATIPFAARVVDAYGNPVAGESIKLAIGTNPNGSTLSVTTNPAVTDLNGKATFSGVFLNKAGLGYKLTATDMTTPAASVATSTDFNIVSAAQAKLAFAQQPSNTVATLAIAPAVTVQVLDAYGNSVGNSTAPVMIAIGTNPGGSTLSGTVAMNAVNGVASFNNLKLDKVGLGYILNAGSTGLTSGISSSFDITYKLAFLQQPSNAAAGVGINPAVTVQVQDAMGTPIATNSLSVTMGIAANPSGSSLGGTLTQPTVSGVATFGNVTLYKTGAGYTLSASGAELSGATSDSFNDCRAAQRRS